MHVNTVHTAALAKITKPAVVHPGKILPGKLLFPLSIVYVKGSLSASVTFLPHREFVYVRHVYFAGSLFASVKFT